MNPKPLARQSDIVVQQSGDETLIYDLKTNKAVCLNDTSAAVWKLCNGKRNVSEISDELSVKFKAPITQELVMLALNQLGKDGMLKNIDTPTYFEGLSRREVIAKIGFGSLVALPMISTLVAPRAANAQSCYSGVMIPSGNLPPATPMSCASKSPCHLYCQQDCCNGATDSHITCVNDICTCVLENCT